MASDEGAPTGDTSEDLTPAPGTDKETTEKIKKSLSEDEENTDDGKTDLPFEK
jgi:hypothetical protein